MRLHFLGANKQVTGSRYRLEAAGLNILIDCGMFQERPFLKRNWNDPPFPPESIDFLLLTHAHLDHVGLVPRLVSQGFNKPIITVEPSVDLAEIVMLDAARIQEEDAQYKAKRHQKEGRRPKHTASPLYTVNDAKKALPLFRGVKFREPVQLNDQVTVTFREAGHILGSAFLEIAVKQNNATRRIVFSGDLGQWSTPLINDPTPLDTADCVVMESTYGDRSHKDAGTIEEQLANIITDTTQRGGNVVIPTFAVERAQELIYYMGKLIESQRIPTLPVYLDSPMAINVTELFHRYCRYLNEESRCNFEQRQTPDLKFPSLRLARTAKESIAINNIKGTNIILSSSGMCTGGRIKHHLRRDITNPNATILFVGYQAQGTLGRQIVNGDPEVRIHGRHWPVKAKIAQIFGMSAHGDRDDLLHWLTAAKQPPKQLFLTHGEEDAATALAATIKEKLGLKVTVPDYEQTIDLT